MGQTLSEPITEKHTSSGMDDRLFYAASGMQGWRISMEDAHATLLHIKANMTENTDPKCVLFLSFLFIYFYIIGINFFAIIFFYFSDHYRMRNDYRFLPCLTVTVERI